MTAPCVGPIDNQPEVAVCPRVVSSAVAMHLGMLHPGNVQQGIPTAITERKSELPGAGYHLTVSHGLSTPRSRANCSTSFPKVGRCVRRSRIRIWVNGHQTSLRLEPQFWFYLRQVAAEQGRSAKALIEGVVSAKDPRRPLSSALRVYVTQYLHDHPLQAGRRDAR